MDITLDPEHVTPVHGVAHTDVTGDPPLHFQPVTSVLLPTLVDAAKSHIAASEIDTVGTWDGITLGTQDGAAVGEALGTTRGTMVGELLGMQVGPMLGASVGTSDGIILGILVGVFVGEYVG